MTDAVSWSREVRLSSRPEREPSAVNFELVEVDLPAPAAGEVQVRNRWMSVDPYMRGRMMTRKSYVPPFEIGQPLQGGAVGEVVASTVAAFAPGDLVQSMFGWREAFNAPPGALEKLPDLPLPPEAYLGVAGLPGLTAYVGLLQIARVAEGDVVFVTAAAGAVGSVVCQLAKIRGAKVIGSAGGEDGCAYLRDLGVDAAIDYKAESDLSRALSAHVPDGIDVCFENVGGVHLQAALDCAKPHGRIALCGAIANYNVGDVGAKVDVTVAVRKSLRLEGFVVSDYFDQMPAFRREMARWIADGQVRYRQTVEHGIAAAPGAFLALFAGKPPGKMLVAL